VSPFKLLEFILILDNINATKWSHRVETSPIKHDKTDPQHGLLVGLVWALQRTSSDYSAWIPLLRLASLTRDDWAASGDILRQVGTGDEHPPGMPAACPPFSSLPLVRSWAPRVLGDVFFVIRCSASVPPYEFNIIYVVQLGQTHTLDESPRRRNFPTKP
jgi:hypothetical protein